MRRTIAFAFLSLVACSGSGPNDNLSTASAKAQKVYDVSGFTGVVSRGSTDVSITTGGPFAVRASGPRSGINLLDIRREGSDLSIGMKDATWRSDRNVHVYVTMPKIERASTRSSGDLDIARVDGDFSGDVQGSGDIALSSVRADQLSLSIAGWGDITASGEAETLNASVNGSGDIDARQLRTHQATVSIAGSGDVDAAVQGNATVSIMGSGDANMGPDARCTVNSRGSGSVNCG
tara:strand:+ start:1709 stop:2413 length:705 start_codon:yes stop_codon:yes gene_type:complete